jgi:hypothetical protein
MAQYQPKIQDVVWAQDAFYQLKEVQYLADAISETLCNGDQDKISDKVRYLFSLLVDETNSKMQELEDCLERLSGNS